MLPTRNGVTGVTGSPAALATPLAAVLVVLLRTIRAATPPSRPPANSTRSSSSANVCAVDAAVVCLPIGGSLDAVDTADDPEELAVDEPRSSEAQAADDTNAATAKRHQPIKRRGRSLTFVTPGTRPSTTADPRAEASHSSAGQAAPLSARPSLVQQRAHHAVRVSYADLAVVRARPSAFAAPWRAVAIQA